MDWVGKGNPYALAPWVRDTRNAALPGDQAPGKRKPVMQLRARHHTLTLWKRFDKRFLQKKNAAIVSRLASGETSWKFGLVLIGQDRKPFAQNRGVGGVPRLENRFQHEGNRGPICKTAGGNVDAGA